MNSIEWYPPEGDLIQFTTGRTAPFRLLSVADLEPVNATPVAIKSPSQPGETALDVTIPPRVLVVQGLMQAADMDALWDLRRTLSRACAAQPARHGEDLILGRLRLLRSNGDPLELDARVKSVSFPMPKGSVGVIGFDIEFYAPNPYWREVEDEAIQLTGSGGFEFPLIFTEEFPSYNIEEEIINSGDVDVAIVARLYGACENPRLINVTTGETIEILTTLTADEYIELNTGFGQKTIEKVTISTGARVNAFSSLNPDSDLWSLRPGTNIVTFEADVNTSGRADVYWRERYAGV